MPKPKITREELEKRLQGQHDPARSLPAGFPTMHSRIRPTPSSFVVAALERVRAEGKADNTPDPADVARRKEHRERREAAAAARRR